MNRFIVIIQSPGRLYTDYDVIDTLNMVRVAECSLVGHAESIAEALNWRERKLSEPPKGFIAEHAEWIEPNPETEPE